MNNKTDRCVPRQGVGGAWEVQVLSLSLWGTVIASPILFSLHLPCPSLQFIGGGRWRRQNRNTHLGSCCSFPILFIFCLFFFFNQSEVLPPTVFPGDHHQACSFQMPQPPCLFQVTSPFHFLS